MAKALNRSRPFTVLDTMILVAATAAGLSMARFFVVTNRFWIYGSPPGGVLVYKLHVNIYRYIIFCSLIILAWSLSFLVLRFRHPRRRPRHLLCLPGTIPCVTSAILTLFAVGFSLARLVAESKSRGYYLSNPMVLFMPYYVKTVLFPTGLAIVVGWTILVLGGRFRPESGWIDRCGMILGGFWIACSTATIWYSI
jgi:hypothetical protein